MHTEGMKRPNLKIIGIEKGGKFRNVHCRTWNMQRKLKIMENEKNPLDYLKNDEITAKREK